MSEFEFLRPCADAMINQIRKKCVSRILTVTARPRYRVGDDQWQNKERISTGMKPQSGEQTEKGGKLPENLRVVGTAICCGREQKYTPGCANWRNPENDRNLVRAGTCS